MQYLIGIDLGTTGTRTVLFDSQMREIASSVHEYPMHQPHNGWAEQAPEDWWQAAAEGLRDVLQTSGIKPGDIAGVGLSGQMHGLVMLDGAGQVLRPAIIWCDQRTQAQTEWMERQLTREACIQITANPPMTGFTAAKLLWVKQQEPEVYARCAQVLLPKDYIRYRLTGQYLSEVSDGAGTQMMDVPKRRWSQELMRTLGLDIGLLPPLTESQAISSSVSKEGARQTGLIEGTPVSAGAADNAAAAIGTGVVRQGQAFTTLGSSGVVYSVVDQVRIDPEGRVHTLCASVPGKWTVMSCTQAAGLSLRWLRDTVCQPEVMQAEAEGVDPYVVMTRLAQQVRPGAERLLFLPFLMGERSPHPDPNCRGVFFGLSAVHGRAQMIRAVMEGVAFSQAACVDVFGQMSVSIDSMMMTGGGARSPLWRQMLADLYGCPVSTLARDQGPAFGAAILAGVGVGLFSDLQTACDQFVSAGDSLQPDPASAAQYQPYYQLYKSLYPLMKPAFEHLAAIG